MTNEEAIRILKNLQIEFNENYVDYSGVNGAFNLAFEALRKKNERPQGEWIPVSERLPEKMGTYLVTLEYKEHGKGITTLWYHGKGIGWDLRVADVVIAWQPLPEPYKEEGAE